MSEIDGAGVHSLKQGWPRGKFMPFDCVTEGLESLLQRALAPHQKQETGFLVADVHDLRRISDRVDRQGVHKDRRKPLDALKKGLHKAH